MYKASTCYKVQVYPASSSYTCGKVHVYLARCPHTGKVHLARYTGKVQVARQTVNVHPAKYTGKVHVYLAADAEKEEHKEEKRGPHRSQRHQTECAWVGNER